MKNILLTGGCGFIGSHTCVSLLEKGYKVTIIDSLVNSNLEVLNKINILNKNSNVNYEKNLDFKFGDLNDRIFIKTLFESAGGFDGVIHFAALKSVGESIDLPMVYWENNVGGTINLLNVMNQFNCKTLIFSSSATIYGNKNNSYVNEESNIEPINPYGSTKASIETFLKDIFNSDRNNWKIINLRYFNPIGAHKSGLLGESPNGLPTNIFPIILKVASNEIEKLMVFGKDWNTKDGTGIRDYIHVLDVAEAHIKSLEFLFCNDAKFLNLNLGTGIGTSVLELIKTFEKVNNVKVPYSFTKKRKGDSACTVADNTLLKSVLGWYPKRTLEEMCRDGWNWRKNQVLKISD